MARRLILIFCFASLLWAPLARAESLFLGAPATYGNIQVIKVDTKYTIADVTGTGIGKFTATGTPTSFAAVSNNITGGVFKVEVFFDLLTGKIRYNDTRNLIEVSGALNGGSQQMFMRSTSVRRFGSGSNDIFDLLFRGNSGMIGTGMDISTRIMGVSISNFTDPTFNYTLRPNSRVGDIVWDNTPLPNGVERGTANVWVPIPQAGVAGFILMGAFGGFGALRRSRHHDCCAPNLL